MAQNNYPILITPTQYEKSKMEEEEKRRLRDQSIVNMRLSDPKYWSLQRLAKHWKLNSKQHVALILKRNGID